MSEYSGYRGLPMLAGLCSMEEALGDGLSVEECVRRLKRMHYCLKRLHRIFNDRLTAEPVYELKMGFSLHSHLCAEQATVLRQRVGEMREPPLGMDTVPCEALKRLFDEIANAPDTEDLIRGLYLVAVPQLRLEMEKYRADTHPLADAPTRRLLRATLLDLKDIEDYGEQVQSAFGLEETEWSRELGKAWEGELIEKQFSAEPRPFDGVPQRDARFPDPYNMGVNAEVFLYDKTMPVEPKTLMMYYKRLREIDVPEMMASIIAETGDQPWAYYRDMTRQLWDEARHAMMGEVGFAQKGVDWSKHVMVNFTWSLALNTQLTPKERHAVLYFIEQGLMPKNGKRYEWEVGKESGNPLSALFQDFDWADEVLHARVGRDWYVSTFEDPKEAIRYGDECWSRVLMDWNRYKDSGKTEHRNWWPECYQAACDSGGLTPAPKVTAFKTSYEVVRADLKNLSASA